MIYFAGTETCPLRMTREIAVPSVELVAFSWHQLDEAETSFLTRCTMTDIPWQARAKLFDGVRAKNIIGSVEECVLAYGTLENAAKLDVTMVSDEPLPIDDRSGTRTTQVSSAGLEWLSTRLPSVP